MGNSVVILQSESSNIAASIVTGANAPSAFLDTGRRPISARVRRLTAEFSVMNPQAPKRRQVRRVILWSTLFCAGLFSSLLVLVATTIINNIEPSNPASSENRELLEFIGSPKVARDIRVEALNEIGRRRLDELKNTPMLFDGSEISIAFAKAAAQIGDLALVPALMKQVDDPDPVVRKASVQALGTLGDRGTSEFLRARIGRELDPQVREKMKAAIEALGKFTITPAA